MYVYHYKVFIYIAQSEPENGAIRFYRNGDSSKTLQSGILQVYYKNSWGNVCFNSSFTKSSADVVCHQLGFTSASSFSSAGKARFVFTDTHIYN